MICGCNDFLAGQVEIFRSHRASFCFKRPCPSIVVHLVFLAGLMAWVASAGQGLAQSLDTPPAVPERLVLGRIDDGKRIVLTGDTHPLARAAFDRGPAPDGLPMERMLLLLKRSPEREAALETFLAEQQDPSSANFHAWLSPEEFGERFGANEQDIEQIAQWLGSHGFAIGAVSSGRTVIEFSGTAGQVRAAFHTDIHKYLVNDAEHWANATDPEIPAALAPAVAGVVSLNDFGLHPMHRLFGPVLKKKGSSRVTPQLSFSDNGTELYAVSPYDFATMYNVLPLWNAGITGAGQSIAVVGQSDIKIADVAAFRKAFDLPALAPQIVTNGSDPGTNAGDEQESDLDVEWAGAVAKNATIKFVTSATTSTTAGVVLSAQYAVDKKVATILTMSYGECEEGLGTTENQLFNALWQQAAGEGITVFVAAGDSGSAGCENHDQQAPFAAQYGLQVNGIASTPYDVALGGTDLNDYDLLNRTNTFSTYWSTTNNATTGASLKKYVPETVWNDSCTIADEAACNNSSNTSFVVVEGGGGGKSACTVFTESCSGGYAKPAWQTGTGVPADGKRDIPDISLFSGNGIRGSFYLICDSDAASDGSCNYSSTDDLLSLGVGGTSAAAPAMAGIQALVNQKLNAAQGNINPTLYALAAKETLSGCNSTNGSGSACVFNDVTDGTNSMPCFVSTLNCQVTIQGDEYGTLPGYNAGTGFDLATGLGSVNATNLVNAWVNATAAPKVTLSATSLAFGNQPKGTTSAAKTVTLTNTGAAALTGITLALAGADVADFTETNNCPASLAVKAVCTITLAFKPAATGALSATVTIKDNAAGSPQSIALSGAGTAPAPIVELSAAGVAFGNQAKGTTSTTRTVTLTNAGSAVLTSLAIVLGGTDPADFTETNNCGTSLAVAAKCTITLAFKPAATASYVATVAIKDNAAGSPQPIALSGTGITPAPAATLSATIAAFGDQAKGTTSTARAITLTNTGTAALAGISIALAGTNPTDFTESNNCGISLAVAAKCTITLAFKPVAAASYAATVSIKDNATGSPQSIALSGTGFTPTPVATLSATSEAFGTQVEATTAAARAVTLTNTGTAALAGITVALGGTNPTDFTETNNCGTSLAIAAKCTITVAFKPAAAAAYAATVSIKDSAASSPQSIALTGTGVAAAPKVVLSTTSAAFGNQVLATTSAAKTVTLTNTGTAVLSSLAIALGGANPTDFIESNNCGVTLAINAACTITLEFKPAAVAAYAATVSIKDNAAGSPQSIALTGTGIQNALAGTIVVYGGEEQNSGYTGNNGPATKATFYYAEGTAEDAEGNVYVADSGNNVIRKINAATGVITTVAGNGYGAGMVPGGYTGDGGPALDAELANPFGVALDKAGNIYIADLYNSAIRKVTAATGIITTVAGNGTFGYSGDGGPATQAEISWPKSVAVDTAGNIYISDLSNKVIRKVTVATGIISTIAGGGNGCPAETDDYGDGCPAVDANFEIPGYGTGTGGIAVDAHGNVFVADPDVETVREIVASTGIIKVVAGNGYQNPNGGGGYSGNGGPATSAELNLPTDVKVDGAGNIFIADSDNNVIREVSASTGKISLVAGIQYSSGGGKEIAPGTAATAVTFVKPNYISVDPSGNLFITDVNDFVVDKVYAAATPLPVN